MPSMALSPDPVKKFSISWSGLKITVKYRRISISQYKCAIFFFLVSPKTLIKKAQAIVQYVGKIIIDQRTNDFSVKHLSSCLTLPVLGNLWCLGLYLVICLYQESQIYFHPVLIISYY